VKNPAPLQGFSVASVMAVIYNYTCINISATRFGETHFTFVYAVISLRISEISRIATAIHFTVLICPVVHTPKNDGRKSPKPAVWG
jgi:hypothetical protein